MIDHLDYLLFHADHKASVFHFLGITSPSQGDRHSHIVWKNFLQKKSRQQLKWNMQWIANTMKSINFDVFCITMLFILWIES